MDCSWCLQAGMHTLTVLTTPMTSAMQQNAVTVLLPSHLPINTCPRHPACELSLNSHCINDWRADTCTSIKGTLGDSITLLGEDLQDRDHSLAETHVGSTSAA